MPDKLHDQAHNLQLAIEARLAGARRFVFPNGVPCATNTGTPLLNNGGYCEAFARCGLQAAGYKCHDPNAPGELLFKATAQETGEAFEAAGYGVPVDGNIYRNDLLFFVDGTPGHVVTYMGISHYGKDTCLENTSSSSRGTPRAAGVKYTDLSFILAAHGGEIARVIRYTGA
jgi:hypothetical protein